MTAKNSILALLLFCAVASIASAEGVCPLDFFLLKQRDGSEQQSQRRSLQEAAPPIKIIRQSGDFVQFVVQNTTSYGEDIDSSVPDHFFVQYATDVFWSEDCSMHEDLGPVNTEDSSSDVITAHCNDIPNGGSMSIVRLYVRSYYGSQANAAIPNCCHDPYASSSSSFNTVEYTYEIRCAPTCDDPDDYTPQTPAPTTKLPTLSPTAAPTTKSPSASPTDFPDLAPPQQCNAAASLHSRDLVMGSQLNGPHWGSRHPWAWPRNNNGCNWFADVDNNGAGANAWPCSVPAGYLDRVLNFDSTYMNFQFKFDQGMKAEISLADTAGADAAATSSVTVFPSGASALNACSKPPEQSWHDYPIRLVKSGRYHHHWYVERINCNGGSDDTRIEIKVTPDCVELHMVSNAGAQNMNWLDANGTPQSSSTNGYSSISYCVECSSEGSNPYDDLSGCSIVEKPIPTDCCTLNPQGPRDPTKLCGSGWEYDICPGTSVATTEMTQDVTLSTVENYPITADGHSFQIAVPRGSGSQMVNDEVTAIIHNHSNGWKKIKINFHIVQPRRITGVSGVLVDPTTGQPTGIHVQMSKNWHPQREALYDSYWWSGIAHFRVPPGETRLKLVVAYQYYESLHGVSHSQLSLCGWATNGLWEEVGLGSNGESITFEPHGHHRRQMILDTRPWLVGAGDPDNTYWTENHGGGDFLNAVDKMGFYQYLVKDTVFHTMNGPRLTNATYSGITKDSNIAVSRTVSTWTADDFVRHLHSFRYEFLKDTPGDHYPRFALYTLGGDNYNYVQFPLFAYGAGDENSFLQQSSGDAAATVPVAELIEGVADFHYTEYYSVDAPVGCSSGSSDGSSSSSSCWFAMLTNPDILANHRAHRGIIIRNFQAQLNGQAWPPPGEAVSPFTFNLIKSRQNGSAQNTVSIELGLPTSFQAAVDLGQASFQEGDFLSADIELLLPPRQSADYNGDSQHLRTWLSDAGVDSSYPEGWKLIAREATEGDSIVTTVLEGELERLYHPRIKVNCPSNEARFNIRIPPTLPGILPITIAGVGTNFANPLETPTEQLWRHVDGNWQPFCTAAAAAYQLEKDVLDNSYTFVYSLSLEFANPSSGPPANACEHFYFGNSPPSDPNPPCQE